jgi:ABC-type xylose transport system permease subunit
MERLDEKTRGLQRDNGGADEDALAESAAEVAVSPELAAGSLRDYLRLWLARLRAGESGVLPVVVGLIAITIIFQSLNSKFLTSGNIVNLLVQGAVFMMLALAEVFALLLGEIDLSAGFVAGLSGVVTAELLTTEHGSWPWWAAILAALLACAAIGLLHGTLITRLGLPSFVVTLGGLLGWQGVMLAILGNGGTLPIQDNVVNDVANANLTPAASWIVTLVLVAVYGLTTWRRAARRRARGLVAPPVAFTLIKIAGVAVAGVVLVLVCNADRGVLVPIRGMPWVLLIVVAVATAWSILLGRTSFGRHVYAIGGNAEAARRSGIRLARVRTLCFVLASFTAGMAGIIYASRLRSVSTNIDGGTLVLYAVAAAVIGGTSLFGGRGKAIHAVLGGIVIAAIDNGMGLQGFSAASRNIVTAIVLIGAVTVDAVARRSATTR